MASTNFWVSDVVELEIGLENELTFYAKYGDFLGRGALLGSLVLLIIFIYRRIKNKKLTS